MNKNNPFKDLSGIDVKRDFLSNLSIQVKPLAEATGLKVNDVLIQLYKNDDHKEFNTFQGWKKKGYKVKKGAKAFCIWSKPIEVKDEDKEEDELEDKTYFGIAHIFSNYQVEKMEAQNE